ncbi:3330_t:CDS:2, partial [Gigaspora margarita]
DRNQTSVNPPLPPPGQNGNLNQEPLHIKLSNEPAVQILPQAHNVNLCDLKDTGYYSEGEDAFVNPMAQHQPNSTQRPQRNLKKSESKAEEKLRVNLPEFEPVIPHICNTSTSSRSPAIEPSPSIEDIDTNVAQLILSKRTTTAHCYVHIKNNPIMMNKLDLKIDEPSTTIVVTVNGTKKRALGKIKDVKLAIHNLLISTLFQVIESSKDYCCWTAEVLISTNSRPPVEVVKEPSESEKTFDEFEYKDEALEEAEGFYTEEISDDDIFRNPWEDY